MADIPKIYLDNCSLYRPWDDRNQVRIKMEAEAILVLTGLFEVGQIELLSSQALRYEVSLNPNVERRIYGESLLTQAKSDIKFNDEIDKKAAAFETLGIKTMDALHLASAVYGEADYFCSCDDRFLNKAKATDTHLTQVVTPLELIQALEQS